MELVCPHESHPKAVNKNSTLVVLDDCLSNCPIELPFELLTLGVGQVIARIDSCPDTQVGELGEKWRNLANSLAIAGFSVTVATPEVTYRAKSYAQSQMPTSTRRGIFGLNQAADSPKVGEIDESLTHHQRLRRAVRTILGVTGIGVAAPDDLPQDSPSVGLVLGAENCDLLGVCAQACPQGALALHTTDGVTQLLQDPGRCSGCGICLKSCPAKALQVTGRAGWQSLAYSQLVQLSRRHTSRCRKCQVEFPIVSDRPANAGRGLCPTCSFKFDNPFASITPEQMIARFNGSSGQSSN